RSLFSGAAKRDAEFERRSNSVVKLRFTYHLVSASALWFNISAKGTIPSEDVSLVGPKLYPKIRVMTAIRAHKKSRFVTRRKNNPSEGSNILGSFDSKKS